MRIRRKRFGVESLEPRAMLAGDVSVSVVNGNLFIAGDELDNAISIAAGAEANSYVITGLDAGEEGDLATLINGEAEAFIATGVDGRISIHMDDGDDSVAVADLDTQGDLSIHTGDGNDAISLAAGLSVDGKLRVHTGEGDDTVTSAELSVTGRVSLRTGAGNDSVSLAGLVQGESDDSEGGDDDEDGPGNNGRGHAFGLLHQWFGGGHGLHVDLGSGDDTLVATNLDIATKASIQGGAGDDDLSLTDVAVGVEEEVEVASNIPLGGSGGFLGGLLGRGNQPGSLHVDGGSGDNLVDIAGVSATKFHLETGGDDDVVTLSGIVSDDIKVDLGSGDDSLAIAASTVDRLMVELGRGDDELTLAADLDVNVRLSVDGGLGADSLIDELVSDLPLNRLLKQGFEIV